MTLSRDYILDALAWEKSEDYNEGLRLWKQRYGDQSITYRALCTGDHPFNRDKMRDGLMKEVEPIADETTVDSEKTGSISAAETAKLESEMSDLSWNLDDLKDRMSYLEDTVDDLTGANLPPEPIPAKAPDEPDEIREMRDTTYSLMDERIALKQRLRELPDPGRRADRQVAALRILAITDELDVLFAKIDYFREHGRVPQDIVIKEDDIKLPKRMLNIRTYISKTLKKINESKDTAKKKELEKVLEHWRKQLSEIETEL
ncbi:hypothetical protein SAMN04487996_10447 [Dyadobacter soli]|uniref:Uncharacterized protein n=2 Tax=Dyadobacter soli TaxID=659014 RepID=A0A1G7B166_9BACT|nr:hypothetical protein SAMN04487996_10447 [Dyadobacter soli]